MATGITEFAAGFAYGEEERGISATQVYIYDPDDSVDHNVDFPVLGSKLIWPLTYQLPFTNFDSASCGLICRKRSIEAIEGDERKIKVICSFSNEPVDEAVFYNPSEDKLNTSTDNLPINLEYSGEFKTINPNSTQTNPWKWASDSTPVNQAIAIKVNTSTIRLQRYVNDDFYSIFTANVEYCAGRVNGVADSPSILAGGIGSWLFTGCTTEMFRNGYDEKYWRAELMFTKRNPDGDDENGWNKLLRTDNTSSNGIWDEPKNPNPIEASWPYIYLPCNFLSLFDESELPDQVTP